MPFGNFTCNNTCRKDLLFEPDHICTHCILSHYIRTYTYVYVLFSAICLHPNTHTSMPWIHVHSDIVPMYAASRSKMHLSSSFRFSQGKEAQSEWRIASTFGCTCQSSKLLNPQILPGKCAFCTVRSSFNKRKHSRSLPPASTNGSAMNDTVQSNHVVTENKLKEKPGMVCRNEANRKNSGSQL